MTLWVGCIASAYVSIFDAVSSFQSRHTYEHGARAIPAGKLRMCSSLRLTHQDAGNLSSRRVLSEHIVPCFRDRVTCDSALRVIPLRWLVGQRARRKRLRRGVVAEHRIAPSTTIGKALAVFHHEV